MFKTRIRVFLLIVAPALAVGMIFAWGIGGFEASPRILPLGPGEQGARVVYLDVPVQVQDPVRPQPFQGDDGQTYLVYHLFITNWGIGDLEFARLEFLDADQERAIAIWDTEELRRPTSLRMNIPDPYAPESAGRLKSGRTAILRAWLPVPAGQAPPRRLAHRFTFNPSPAMKIARSQTDTDAAPVITAATLTVDLSPVVVLAPPLSGGIWKASGAGGPRSYHGGAASLDGETRLAERFAVDFQKVDAAGNILPNPFPNELTNAMFYSNRAEVYAVEGGVVALVRDGIPENVPTPSGNENMPIPLTRESSAGNQISIKLAEGIYAQYAHLVPGSIRFKPGDRVRRGQVIGLVGNSGNSKNPHLHFEIADGPEINAAQGLPWVFESFELYGHVGPGGMPDVHAAPVRHRNEMPLTDAILRFPEPPRR